jgi:hypothetical protein
MDVSCILDLQRGIRNNPIKAQHHHAEKVHLTFVWRERTMPAMPAKLRPERQQNGQIKLDTLKTKVCHPRDNEDVRVCTKM